MRTFVGGVNRYEVRWVACGRHQRWKSCVCHTRAIKQRTDRGRVVANSLWNHATFEPIRWRLVSKMEFDDPAISSTLRVHHQETCCDFGNIPQDYYCSRRSRLVWTPCSWTATNFRLEVDEDALWTPRGSFPSQHLKWINEASGFPVEPRHFLLLFHQDGNSDLITREQVSRIFQAVDKVRDVPGYESVCEQLPATGACQVVGCLLYTSPSPRDRTRSRMPSSA